MTVKVASLFSFGDIMTEYLICLKPFRITADSEEEAIYNLLKFGILTKNKVQSVSEVKLDGSDD